MIFVRAGGVLKYRGQEFFFHAYPEPAIFFWGGENLLNDLNNSPFWPYNSCTISKTKKVQLSLLVGLYNVF